MEIRTFEQLILRDQILTDLGWTEAVEDAEHGLRFERRDWTPERMQEMVVDCELVAAVPDRVRDYFDTCRTLHSYGYFRYGFFTVVVERVYFTLEAALGARLVQHYEGHIPLVQRGTQHREILDARSFADVDRALQRSGRFHHRNEKGGRGWDLDGHPRFEASMASLLRWARDEDLLYGQRNKGVEDVIVCFRNAAAHPEGPHRVGWGESAGAIRDVAEIINHLWGRETPGGRLYGTPHTMTLFVVHWTADGTGKLACHAEHLPTLQGEADGPWFLVEAVETEHEDSLRWHPDFETTAYPTVLVWAGDTWEGAVAAWQAYRAAGRAPQPTDWRNRLFLIRHDDGGFEAPRSPGQFHRLPSDQRDLPGKRWLIGRADYPGDFVPYFQLQLEPNWDQKRFSVERVGDFSTWAEAAKKLDELGAPP